MGEFGVWLILGVMMFFTYNMFMLNFASKILKDCSKNLVVHVIVTSFNIAFVFTLFYNEFPRYLLYLLFFVVLTLQFKLLSKATLSQSVFGAACFVLNISPMHLISVILLSVILDIPSTHFFMSYDLTLQALFWTFFALSVILIIFIKIVPIKDILEISNSKTYAEVISTLAFVMIINTSIDSWLFVTDEIYIEIILMVIVSAILYYVLFYYTFMFSRSLVNLHHYKRKSDEIEFSYHEVINKKSKVEEKLYTDDLTGLYNRKYFNEKLDILLSDKECSFAVFFIDIVALKYVNDTYGHESGDRYIKRVADVLRDSVREHDTVARISGDEFIVVAEAIEKSDIKIVLERIQRSMSAENNREDFLVHINIGTYYVEHGQVRPQKSEIIEEVDKRMREDKKNFYSAMRSL